MLSGTYALHATALALVVMKTWLPRTVGSLLLNGRKSAITSFRNNRFNNYFKAAAALHFHWEDVAAACSHSRKSTENLRAYKKTTGLMKLTASWLPLVSSSTGWQVLIGSFSAGMTTAWTSVLMWWGCMISCRSGQIMQWMLLLISSNPSLKPSSWPMHPSSGQCWTPNRKPKRRWNASSISCARAAWKQQRGN